MVIFRKPDSIKAADFWQNAAMVFFIFFSLVSCVDIYFNISNNDSRDVIIDLTTIIFYAVYLVASMQGWLWICKIFSTITGLLFILFTFILLYIFYTLQVLPLSAVIKWFVSPLITFWIVFQNYRGMVYRKTAAE